MQYFIEMEEAGIQPDLKAYNSLISACARGARWEDAWDFCSSMRRSAISPNTRTYNALISACERAGQPERALEAFRRMQKESGKRAGLGHHVKVSRAGDMAFVCRSLLSSRFFWLSRSEAQQKLSFSSMRNSLSNAVF